MAARQEQPQPPGHTLPSGLSEDFGADSTKQTQWRAFLRKATDVEQHALNDVIARLRQWLWPVLDAARAAHTDTDRAV